MAISTLITKSGTPQAYTANRETDARTALTRGLAEYLSQMVIDAKGGRQIRFKKVFQTWAEPEEQAQYPSAIVYSAESGRYEESKFTPSPDSTEKISAPDNRYLVSATEFVIDLKVEVWATDPKERAEICAALEAMFNPVDFMYGFQLEFPHYYGMRGVYELKDMQYLDTEIDAMRRYRKAAFTLSGQVPVVNLFTYPDAKMQIRLDLTDASVITTEVEVS